MATEETLILLDAAGEITDKREDAVRGEATRRNTDTGEVESILFTIEKQAATRAGADNAAT